MGARVAANAYERSEPSLAEPAGTSKQSGANGRGVDIVLQTACRALVPKRSNRALSVAASILLMSGMAQAESTVRGRVLDASGAVIANADVQVRMQASGREYATRTDAGGKYELTIPAAGPATVVAQSPGFGVSSVDTRLRDEPVEIELKLSPEDLAQSVRVTGGFLVFSSEELNRLPGSGYIITPGMLTESRVMTTEEALRKAPGVHARNEDALGLRPNIGIRGLSPTRSTKVLLLEDGLPLSYAPYGDNASYYHPPIDRFETVEVIKGGEQILHGPMTIGGVINYVTPAIPSSRGGHVTLIGGNRDYLNAHARYGGNWRGTGLMVDGLRKQGEGSRDNTRHGIHDFNVKTLSALRNRQTLGLRFNTYGEDSRITYSGLRQSEFDARPRANPFLNDKFTIGRHAGAVTHTMLLRENMILTTNGYASAFNRDWWRQSSNSNQRPNDSADPACGGMANLLTSCGNEGRLRSYMTWGLDPRVKTSYGVGGGRAETDFGMRFHSEFQGRVQKNGPLPNSRDGVMVEDNDRTARAVSGFLQNRFLFGRLAITPGLRIESMRFQRTNWLANAGRGVSGDTNLYQWLPGIGASFTAGGKLTLFTGLHRGFAPPRVEDIVNNNTGQSVDIDSERSWNYEAGARLFLAQDLRAEATFFRMDFENQIVPSSVAGGAGATLTNAGETLHQGAEVAGTWSTRRWLPSRHALEVRGAWTWLPAARFAGTRFSNIAGFTNVSVRGNRLPYAPKSLLNASVGYFHARGFNLFLENVYTGSQFGDDLNTAGGTPDGQRGLIPSNNVWNATANLPVERWHATFFLMAKNLGNRLTIVDRSRGILPGIPRLVQAGVRFSF